MKNLKKLFATFLAASMTVCMMTACDEGVNTLPTPSEINVSDISEDGNNTQESLSENETETVEAATVNIGSLKGPTSMGLMKMMDDATKGEYIDTYNFEMAVTADEILPKVVSGQIDIALVPANVASVLYNKTEGEVTVIDINTLGVLYAVSGDDSITSVSDLKGRDVYVTNKGTTPDYVFQYLLKANGLTTEDVNIEYKSEAAEVTALLSQKPDSIGILPQPFATASCIKDTNLKEVLDLTAEWDNLQTEDGSRLVTGVTIVRNEFLLEHPDAVERFLEAHKASAEYTQTNPDETASLAVASGIIEKEPVAVKAIPKCNIVYIDGVEMKNALEGYLKVLYEFSPESVGGKLPGEDFYR